MADIINVDKMQMGPADQTFEQHVYNHYDVRPPEVNFEVAETTRGATTKVEVKYVNLDNWEQAVELYERTRQLTTGKQEDEAEEGQDAEHTE